MMNQNINQSSLGLMMLTPYQLNKEIIINENTKILDAWAISGGIISRKQNQIPAIPSFGDKYIIPNDQSVVANEVNEETDDVRSNHPNHRADQPNNSNNHSHKPDTLPNEPMLDCENSSDPKEKCQDNVNLDKEQNRNQDEKVKKWPAGYNNQIALYAEKWVYIKPRDGMMSWLVAEKAMCVYYDGDWNVIEHTSAE